MRGRAGRLGACAALGPDGVDVPLEVRLPGEFNVANAIGALALLAAAGVDPLTAADGIAACDGVPGRMERVPDPDLERGLLAFVDYAHTPDAVERALAAPREIGARRARRALVVLGAGGDRDPHKRFDMGRGGRARRRRRDRDRRQPALARTRPPSARAVLRGVTHASPAARGDRGGRPAARDRAWRWRSPARVT